MAYNLSQLLATETSDTKLTAMLATLTGKGYAATAWPSGGVQRTLIELMPIALAAQDELLAAVAAGGYLDEAEQEWLTALASEMYLITRTPAQSAEYTVTLTESAGSPQVITLGALWVGTPTGLRYQNTEGKTLPANEQVSIRVRAESPGARFNTGAGTIIIMHTPIPGVTVTNVSANPVVAGLDAESDPTLRTRCKAKWEARGAGGNEAAYIAWAMDASTSVKKVKLAPATGDGTVTIYIAGDSSGLGAEIVSAVYTYIRAKCPTCASPIVVSASTQPIDVAATVTIAAGYEATYETYANAALDEVFKALPIGGSVYVSQIITALLNPLPPAVVATLAAVSAPTLAITPATDIYYMPVKGTVTITPA